MRWLVLLSGILKVVGKGSLLVPAVFYRRHQGIKAFRKALRHAGMNTEQIEQLVGVYREQGDLLNYVRGKFSSKSG